MRGWLSISLMGLACSTAIPMGAYRVPVQTGADSVELRTMIVSLNGAQLTLYDAQANEMFGVGQGEIYSDVPFQFSVPAQYPLALSVSAPFLQDSAVRPYQTIALPPLDANATSLTRYTLTSGADQVSVVSSGGNYFTEVVADQPQLADLPGPLFGMTSVAGTGLWLPADIGNVTVWQDAMSTLAPASPTAPTFCGAPLISKMQATPQVTVQVPAGTFQATQVKEVISTCDSSQAASLRVYEMDRWYVTGVGPVRMTYQGADAKTRSYDLVSDQVTGDASALWPLTNGNRWTYRITGPDGTVSPATADVTVTSAEVVTDPGA